jgi:hypothetical protein
MDLPCSLEKSAIVITEVGGELPRLDHLNNSATRVGVVAPEIKKKTRITIGAVYNVLEPPCRQIFQQFSSN